MARVRSSSIKVGTVLFFVVARSSNPRVTVDKVSEVHRHNGQVWVKRAGARWEPYDWGIEAFAEEEAAKAAAAALRPVLVNRLQRTVTRANARLAKLAAPVQVSDPGKLRKAQP